MVELNKKKVSIIEEEGFLEDKSFMDIRQIQHNRILAVTYDAFYYVI